MSMLKLDDFKENKQSDTEKFIDRWAWRLENESPAECADLKKYKDYAGNESMWKDILRTVKNAISNSRFNHCAIAFSKPIDEVCYTIFPMVCIDS